MSAIAQAQVEDDARAFLAREISAGRLSPTPSLEVLGRIAVMLTGPVAQPRSIPEPTPIGRVHRPSRAPRKATAISK